MSKLAQAIQQLQAAGAVLSVHSYVVDVDAFRSVAMLSGAKVEKSWTTYGDRSEIREFFAIECDGANVHVSTLRAPTAEDWSEQVVASRSAAKVLVGVFGGKQ